MQPARAAIVPSFVRQIYGPKRCPNAVQPNQGARQADSPQQKMVCQLGSQRDVEEPHRYPHRVPHQDRENHSGHRYRRNPELQCQRNDERHTEGDEHKRVGVFCTWMLSPSGVGARRIHRRVRPSCKYLIGCTCTTPTTSRPGWPVVAWSPVRPPNGAQARSAAGDFAVLRYRGALKSSDAVSGTRPMVRSHHQETFF